MRGCACGFENESAVTLPANTLGGVNYRRLGVAEQPRAAFWTNHDVGSALPATGHTEHKADFKEW